MSSSVAEGVRNAATAWASSYVAALAELSELPRTKTARVETRGGGSYSYSYADLADVLTYVRPILSKHSLCVSQTINSESGAVGVRTWLWHAQGHVWSSGELSMQTSGLTPQQIGSAITYARRYSLLAMLGLATEEDDDAQSASKPVKRAASKRGASRRDDVDAMTEPQAEMIGRLLDVTGYSGAERRDARLTMISRVVGREITDARQLTSVDAAKLILALQTQADEEREFDDVEQ